MVDLYNTNTNKIIIPWSGGVDSTNILFQVLKYIKNNKFQTKGVYIYLESIEAEDDRGIIESKARKNILKYIKKKYPKLYLRIKYNTTSRHFSGYSFNSGDLPQAYWWLTHIYGNYGSNCTILFGYHKGDDFWTKYGEFKNLIRASDDFFSNQKNKHIYYPLAYLYKDEVFNGLPKKIKKMVKWCESPKNMEVCNKCGSCETHNKFIKD